MGAQNLHRLVGAGIVIGDDRVDMRGEIIERVGQDQRLVAHTREPDQEMLLPEQRVIAFDDPLAVAELPAMAGARHTQKPSTTAATQTNPASAMTRTRPPRRDPW